MAITFPVSYTTISLIYQTLPDIGSVTTLTSAHLANFAGQGEALINAKISNLYSIPLTQEVPILQMISTDIAVYNILTRRLFTSKQLETSPWPDRYKESLATLDKIADGTIPLVDSSGAVLSGRTDQAEVYSTTQDYVPTFWEGASEDHIQDADKIDAEADRRGITIRNKLT